MASNKKFSSGKLLSAMAAHALLLGFVSANMAPVWGQGLTEFSSEKNHPVSLPQLAPAAGLASPLGQSFASPPPGIADGGGIWVNLWNYPTKDFASYAEKLYASGIRNLFIQTSRSNTPAIRQPNELGQIIEACHKYKIRVIAWSFAELHDTKADAEKMIVAARFRTPSGDRLDGIAPNLEKNLHREAVEAYTKQIRSALGPDYPMMAVVYSPLNRAPAVAVTPWKTLAQYYDVIAPMAYWNGRYQTIDAYTYTKRTVEKVRALTGKPDVEVHVIGDGMGTHAAEIKEFLRGCADAGAQSASLYPEQLTTAEQFGAMSLYDDFMPQDARARLLSLRNYMASGLIGSAATGRFDPSKPAPRSVLFSLAASAINAKGVNASDPRQAFSLFQRLGVIDTVARTNPEIASVDELGAPLAKETATAFISQLKQVLSSPKAMKRAHVEPSGDSPYITMGTRQRADRLFVAPAYAMSQEVNAVNASFKDSSKLLSTFDAVHLISKLK